MLWSNGLIFDKVIEGLAPLSTAGELDGKLGEVSRIDLFVYADHVASGTSLTVEAVTSSDGVHWVSLSTPISGALTGNTIQTARVLGTCRFTRLNVSLTGALPSARIRIWAAARSNDEGGPGMVTFNEMVLDATLVEGTPAAFTYTKGDQDLLLATPDVFGLFVVADQVSGVASSVLAVRIFESGDGVNWAPMGATPEINETLASGIINLFAWAALEPEEEAPSGFLKVVASLASDPAGSAVAHVRVWATGRSG